jgi:hypothetical protein
MLLAVRARDEASSGLVTGLGGSKLQPAGKKEPRWRVDGGGSVGAHPARPVTSTPVLAASIHRSSRWLVQFYARALGLEPAEQECTVGLVGVSVKAQND